VWLLALPSTGQAAQSIPTAAFSDSRKATLRDTLFASSKLVAFLVSNILTAGLHRCALQQLCTAVL